MLLHCTKGGVAPLMAVTMAAVIGMGALAVEASGWYATKRELQRVADSAAIQGAFIYRDSDNIETALLAAAAVAASNGAGGGTPSYDSTTKTVTSGEITAALVTQKVGSANQDWIQVSLSRTHQNSIGAMFGGTTVIGATGAANIDKSGAAPCILGLKSSGASINLNGTPTVTVSGCSIKSNGDFDTGGNSASITADGLYADGTFKGQGTTSTTDMRSNNQVEETTDPYADNGYFDACAVPSNFTSAPHFELGNSVPATWGDASKGPFYYQSKGGDSIQGTLTLLPGTYVIDGDVKVTTSGTITGDGVSLIVCGNIDTSATSIIDISAPTKDAGYDFAGLAIAANGSGNSTITGGTNTNIDGLVYVPNGNLAFAGHSSSGGGGCLQLVASVVTISGTTSIGGSCEGIEDAETGVTQVALTR